MKKLLTAFLAIAITSLSFGAIVAETPVTYTIDGGTPIHANPGDVIPESGSIAIVNGAARITGSSTVGFGNGTAAANGGEAIVERRGRRSLVSSIGAAGVEYTTSAGTKTLGTNEQAVIFNRGPSTLVVVLPSFNTALPGFTPVVIGTST
jgi:hypothetical protein